MILLFAFIGDFIISQKKFLVYTFLLIYLHLIIFRKRRIKLPDILTFGIEDVRIIKYRSVFIIFIFLSVMSKKRLCIAFSSEVHRVRASRAENLRRRKHATHEQMWKAGQLGHNQRSHLSLFFNLFSTRGTAG